MNLRASLILLAALAVAAGCGVKSPVNQKEPTELDRKRAAHLASEADFAVTIRDHARAEPLFAQAAELVPDSPQYWISLGSTRVRLGRRDAARDAYQNALKAYEKEAATNQNDPEPLLQQAYVLALLGRTKEGHAVLEQAAKRFPNNRKVRAFFQEKEFDRLIADPKVKEIAL
jgi:tetratricopeptide (TPR) repeat protein